MNHSTTYPLTLLYDAACPICASEMDHLWERNGAGRLRFVDITAPGFDPSAWGTTLERLNAELHGVRPDGSVLHGMEVLRLAYVAVGLGWVMRPTRLGPLRPLFDRAYRVFARHRRPISRVAAPWIDAIRAHRARRTSARMARCSAGTCGLDAEHGADGASRSTS